MVRTVALWNFSRIIVGLMMLNTLIIVVSASDSPVASLLEINLLGSHSRRGTAVPPDASLSVVFVSILGSLTSIALFDRSLDGRTGGHRLRREHLGWRRVGLLRLHHHLRNQYAHRVLLLFYG